MQTQPPSRTPVVVLAVIMIVAAVFALSSSANPLGRAAQRYAGQVAAASAGVYITLRSVNAFLSAAQEVEVGGSLVVSGSVQPLKTLEPIDDTIERIAGVVFAMMVITGGLSVAMGPIGAVGAAMIALAMGLWIFDRLAGRRDVIVVLARRLGWYGGFLALAVPLAFLISGLIADRMTQQVWQENDAVIAEITAPIAEDPTAPELQNRLWQALDDLDDYRILAGNIYDRADDLIGSYIAILGVFLFKLLLLPAAIMGGFYLIARFFAGDPGPRA